MNTLLHIHQQIPHPSVRFHRTGQDLSRRQHEPVIACIPQLRCKGILRFGDIVDVIYARARGRVDGAADGTGAEDGAVDGFDGGDDAGGEGLEGGVVGGEDGAGVAIGFWEGRKRVLVGFWGDGEMER